MEYIAGYPLSARKKEELIVNFNEVMIQQTEVRCLRLPAEWEAQSGIQLTWPHAATDWSYMLDEVEECFIRLAREIAQRELLLIVTPHPEEVKKVISATVNMANVRFMASFDMSLLCLVR